MAEMGGFGVDQYLEASFKLPEALMASATLPSEKEATANQHKQTMPDVVHALCDDALNVLGRHPRLACFKAELLRNKDGHSPLDYARSASTAGVPLGNPPPWSIPGPAPHGEVQR